VEGYTEDDPWIGSRVLTLDNKVQIEQFVMWQEARVRSNDIDLARFPCIGVPSELGHGYPKPGLLKGASDYKLKSITLCR
jgi:hypothetical protein